MIVTIHNDQLTLTADTLGAQMQSITSYKGTEYLWNGDERYWKGRAPVLFPFVARLKRASLTGMIRAGKIPNPLIAAAQKLYEGLNKSRVSATFEETAKVMRLVVEEALAEPTMEQLKAAGLDLTEEQADQIYLYAIKGAKVLEAFRSQSANRQPDPSGDDVQAAPQQPDGD